MPPAKLPDLNEMLNCTSFKESEHISDYYTLLYAKVEDIQNSSKASIGLLGRDMIENEKPRKETEGE